MSENRHDEQEGFLTRWSRRKVLSRSGEELPEPAQDADEELPEASAPGQESSPVVEEALPEHPGEEAGVPQDAEPELPPLESLDENSDYSAFLGDGVPADVRQKALNKLFHSPKFNIRDGLDDYDWDFTNPEPLGDIITAEMRYRVERELERLAGLDEDEESPEDSSAVAAVDAGEGDEPDNEVDREADNDRSEPS
ncbi:MAG: DUF3306 domain-containing protein [Gammaproteobacteria bacterium]|jgi:hypothetical protein|nr:DUF3306 domain-containing protein [Gammaproteobacteria bacterium]MDH3756261.1 DUF3306 domain-containing protein [Gammaproteobacteria bacterium]MDH3846233.1 DUF3306 domain-containing protein [Gammaproteobacteria bacterium]MDH3862380.1 DUF3306 domain-containing protein [Gammaproteobacteria bacterium]MDH3905201.1 DUF3306 domain-containing protein [Gammaproteobacteria bacterium]